MDTNSKLSSKLANVKKSIGNNLRGLRSPSPQQSSSTGSLMNQLTSYSNAFRHAVSGIGQSNSASKNQVNSAGNSGPAAQESQNPYILGVLIIIALGFLIYGTYTYLVGMSAVRPGQTFYGEDLLNYDPLFKINADKIEPCMDRCSKDSLCAGITFDADTLTCVASRRGKLRADSNNYYSWVKPVTELGTRANTLNLLGYTSGSGRVKAADIPMPYNPGSMTYTFVLYVDDFYANDSHGSWKHVMHRGTELEGPLKTTNWEDVVKACPDQYCGVWIAPFNNNIRVCITTVTDKSRLERPTYPHANAQAVDPVTGRIYITDKPNNPLADPVLASRKANPGESQAAIAGLNLVKTIEYVDIANIPTKKPVHITVNLDGGSLEVYLNGKLHKILGLHGQPEYNNGDMLVMHPATYRGDLLDLTYTPRSLDKNEIMRLVARLDTLSGKYANEIKNISN
jgi:hypothetical protein